MINTPENNLKLSDNDALAIEEAQKRLLNIETLVSISSKNLRTVKIDTENMTKERLGQEELLSTLISKNKELTDLITSLESTKESKIKEISDSNSLLESIKNKSYEIESRHSRREEDISKKEIELAARENNILVKERDLDESSKLLDEKHAKINAFVENI